MTFSPFSISHSLSQRSSSSSRRSIAFLAHHGISSSSCRDSSSSVARQSGATLGRARIAERRSSCSHASDVANVGEKTGHCLDGRQTNGWIDNCCRKRQGGCEGRRIAFSEERDVSRSAPLIVRIGQVLGPVIGVQVLSIRSEVSRKHCHTAVTGERGRSPAAGGTPGSPNLTRANFRDSLLSGHLIGAAAGWHAARRVWPLFSRRRGVRRAPRRRSHAPQRSAPSVRQPWPHRRMRRSIAQALRGG